MEKLVQESQGTSSNGNGAKKEKKNIICKICSNSYVVLLTHLNKSEDCKKGYGKGYDKLKAKKLDEKKQYLINYKVNYYSQNKESDSCSTILFRP